MARLLPKILLAIATFAVCVGLMVAGAALRGRLVEAPGGSAPREPLTEAPAAPHALTAPPATGRPALEARNGDQPPVFPPSQFVRWPVGPDVVARYFEIDGELTVYDPYSYFRHRGNLDVERPWEEHPDGRWMLRTNSLGMRRDSEPAAERPDLRVLVVGDSHTDGVCDNDESYCALLEAALARSGERVEVLNAGQGGHSFYNYLGTLERFLPLAPDVLVVCVYGGNDFEELLTWHHYFHRTERPPGSALYPEAIERALAVSKPALAQAPITVKYFVTQPGQMEVALQTARDVTTELAVSCRRHGIQPLFCYLPSASEVRWQDHAEVLDGLAAALELERSDFELLGAMADSWLAFARASGLEVLDLRPAFRAAPAPLYWQRDHHISLAGHALVASELEPRVRALRPADAERVRPAPIPRSREDAEHAFALRSPGAYRPGSTVSLDRRRLSAAAAAKVHPLLPGEVYDEHALFRHAAHLYQARTLAAHPAGGWHLRTNALGLRMDEEVREDPPDVRILVTGDGNVDGVCDNADGFPHLLAAGLEAAHPGTSVEVLNAGVGGYSFYNYLGTLERFLPLQPDVFVMVVYGGNDFYEVLELHNYFAGQARPDRSQEYWPLVERALAMEPQSLSQFFNPLKYFSVERPQVAAAAWASEAVTEEVRRTCEEHGIELVVVYLPPACDVEWPALADRLDPVREVLQLAPDDMRTLDVLAGAYLQDLGERGVRVLDLRDVFALHPGPYFWPADLHVDLTAQRLIAEQLVALCGRLPSFANR